MLAAACLRQERVNRCHRIRLPVLASGCCQVASHHAEWRIVIALDAEAPIISRDPVLSDIAEGLTPRQREVLALVARGVRLKSVARELGISEARVNQHVASIKQRLRINELVGLDVSGTDDTPYRNPIERESLLPEWPGPAHQKGGFDPEPIAFHDAMPLHRLAPWEGTTLRVGPGALDGPGAGWKRGAFIVLIALSLPVLVILMIAAMMAITQVR